MHDYRTAASADDAGRPLQPSARTAPTDNDYFKMGAAVAVGELYDAGRLGDKRQVAEDVRSYLASFGITSIDDISGLGMTGPYVEDFHTLYNL